MDKIINTIIIKRFSTTVRNIIGHDIQILSKEFETTPLRLLFQEHGIPHKNFFTNLETVSNDAWANIINAEIVLKKFQSSTIFVKMGRPKWLIERTLTLTSLLDNSLKFDVKINVTEVYFVQADIHFRNVRKNVMLFNLLTKTNLHYPELESFLETSFGLYLKELIKKFSSTKLVFDIHRSMIED